MMLMGSTIGTLVAGGDGDQTIVPAEAPHSAGVPGVYLREKNCTSPKADRKNPFREIGPQAFL